LKRHNEGIEFRINREIRLYPSNNETSQENMDEVTLINIWNAQRKSIAHAQLVSVIIISAVVALIATGQFGC